MQSIYLIPRTADSLQSIISICDLVFGSVQIKNTNNFLHSCLPLNRPTGPGTSYVPVLLTLLNKDTGCFGTLTHEQLKIHTCILAGGVILGVNEVFMYKS